MSFSSRTVQLAIAIVIARCLLQALGWEVLTLVAWTYDYFLFTQVKKPLWIQFESEDDSNKIVKASSVHRQLQCHPLLIICLTNGTSVLSQVVFVDSLSVSMYCIEKTSAMPLVEQRKLVNPLKPSDNYMYHVL
jgi:hypothetical protein